MFSCKFFAAFYQLDMFAFQSLMLYLKCIVFCLELLMDCTLLGKVLVSTFNKMELS